jgi:hypothetical protein
VDRYKMLVSDLPNAVEGHIEPVREKLTQLLGGRVMMRLSEHGGWVGSYRGSYAGLIRLGASRLEVSDETATGSFLLSLQGALAHRLGNGAQAHPALLRRKKFLPQ